VIFAAAMPGTISGEFLEFFNEFEECKTREALFAKAIDQLEPIVHWALYTDDWTKWGFTEQNVREKKVKYLEPFPELLEFFNETMKVLKEQKKI
jgi:5'-deoxynucleotidase YfbR-like HD superfamily hydrolase